MAAAPRLIPDLWLPVFALLGPVDIVCLAHTCATLWAMAPMALDDWLKRFMASRRYTGMQGALTCSLWPYTTPTRRFLLDRVLGDVWLDAFFTDFTLARLLYFDKHGEPIWKRMAVHSVTYRLSHLVRAHSEWSLAEAVAVLEVFFARKVPRPTQLRPLLAANRPDLFAHLGLAVPPATSENCSYNGQLRELVNDCFTFGYAAALTWIMEKSPGYHFNFSEKIKALQDANMARAILGEPTGAMPLASWMLEAVQGGLCAEEVARLQAYVGMADWDALLKPNSEGIKSYYRQLAMGVEPTWPVLAPLNGTRPIAYGAAAYDQRYAIGLARTFPWPAPPQPEDEGMIRMAVEAAARDQALHPIYEEGLAVADRLTMEADVDSLS